MSFTQTFKNVTEVSTDSNPCTGDLGTLTLTYNGVFHVTELTSGIGAGTFWATGTLTGTFSFVPFDSSKPSYAGRFTTWFGDNDNLRNDAETEILAGPRNRVRWLRAQLPRRGPLERERKMGSRSRSRSRAAPNDRARRPFEGAASSRL